MAIDTHSTFGIGGYLVRPIEHGADIVVHSATKWIGYVDSLPGFQHSPFLQANPLYYFIAVMVLPLEALLLMPVTLIGTMVDSQTSLSHRKDIMG